MYSVKLTLEKNKDENDWLGFLFGFSIIENTRVWIPVLVGHSNLCLKVIVHIRPRFSVK